MTSSPVTDNASPLSTNTPVATTLGANTLSEPAPDDSSEWQALLARAAGSQAPGEGLPLTPASPLQALYGPLCDARRAGPFVVGHLAQSLDGRIATLCGVSRWLSGAEDLLHTHRMRALCEAVVVGVTTVLLDDPQLTVRRCAGPNPVRVVIDPDRRLDGSQRLFHDESAPTLLLCGADRAVKGERLGLAEVVPVVREDCGLSPREICRVLALRGLGSLLIEGGGITVSRFLAAGALNRLQITIAPVILGSGRPAIVLPTITDLNNSLRPRTRRVMMGADVMIECDFDV